MKHSVKNPRNDLSADYVRAILDYDPLTGVFKWKRRPEMKNDWNTRWSGKIAGSKYGNGYWYITINAMDYLAHRLAWLYMTGKWPIDKIDHKRGLINNFDNLRAATQKQNGRNCALRTTTTTGFKGVSFCKQTNKYAARINANYKMIWLGRFDTAKEAHDAYSIASKKHHGDFSRTE